MGTIFKIINKNYYTDNHFTRGVIPKREPLGGDYYDIGYYGGQKHNQGINYPRDGSYLNPESSVKYKFIDLNKWVNKYSINGKVLDIGSGPGHFCYWSKKLHTNYKVFGCDISKELLNHPINNNDDYKICSATSLDYEDNSFNAVLLFDILEHLSPDEVVHALQEALRVLKPNGYIFIRIPNRETWTRATWRDQAHVWLPNLSELKDVLTDNGFERKTIQKTTRGFPFSPTYYKIFHKDFRFPVLGSSIMLSARKSY
ncbi:class I SAM-dependent methyltransferase [Candidatus Dojkabacteria bacterium]|nr:class I SAM-dependent methyltransferase [Candidatus Dojkabacteria bacterium]